MPMTGADIRFSAGSPIIEGFKGVRPTGASSWSKVPGDHTPLGGLRKSRRDRNTPYIRPYSILELTGA